MMTIEQYLLISLAEECNEVAQRCIKAARFGITEMQDGQLKTNAERIFLEMCDLLAVYELLALNKALPELRGQHQMLHLMLLKQDKVMKYLQYAQAMGQVLASET